MKYIFQDFDGCLIPSLFKNYVSTQFKQSGGTLKSKDEFGFIFSPICASKLNYIIASTGAVVVIISDWKNRLSLEELQRLWKQRMMSGEVIGVVPEVDTNMRSDAVIKYILEHDVRDYVIIDDLVAQEYSDTLQDRLLLCDSRAGIDNDVMFKAIEILNGKKMAFY